MVGGLSMTGMTSGIRGSSSNLVFRRGAGSGGREVLPKPISTTPGTLGAGETETELDEPPNHLPTSRIRPFSVSPSTVERITPFLFEFSRFLSIFPAVIGTLLHLYHFYSPPPALSEGVGKKAPERIDYAVSALWAILTGYQCLHMTTGLLVRWRVYYPPVATLIRLLALQGICWPATQLTCTVLEHRTRPVAVWAAIGTCTCISRSVQIWVTSNLWWETRDAGGAAVDAGGGGGGGGGDGEDVNVRPGGAGGRRGYWRRWRGGKWGGRRWDWQEVGRKCVLPAGIVYFVMAWAEQLRREFENR